MRAALLVAVVALAPACRREKEPKPIAVVPSAAPEGSLEVKVAIREQGFDLHVPGRATMDAARPAFPDVAFGTPH